LGKIHNIEIHSISTEQVETQQANNEFRNFNMSKAIFGIVGLGFLRLKQPW
jgi:hypothetical protein